LSVVTDLNRQFGFIERYNRQKVPIMKKLNTLAAAVALAAGSQGAQALTPWANGTPDLVVYTSGGAAQDKAYTQVINDVLAASGSVDTFSDVDPADPTQTLGARWTAYYFTGSSTLPSGLAGKKILLEKRIYGAAGYGLIPLLAGGATYSGLPIEHLLVAGTTAAQWVANGTQSWKQTISSTNATTYLTHVVSDAGFSGVDPSILLKPGTINYPTPVKQISTGTLDGSSGSITWPTTLTAVPTTGNAAFTVLPTGGLVYGVAVTLDLYKVLQAAEKRAGKLPSTVTIGAYDEGSLPSLNSNVLASIISGNVGAWEQIKIVDTTAGNAVKTLLDPSILSDAGVSAPYVSQTTGKTPVAVGNRNNGAAVGAVAYAALLNYPSVANSFAPATAVPNDSPDEDGSLPIVKQPNGTTDTGNLLKDWQNGTNLTGYNNVVSGSGFANRWGIAINNASGNTKVTAAGTGGDPWRYIKIDGYAPTLENVASADYPLWAEGTFIFRTTKATDKQWANKVNLFKALANALGSPTVANEVNPTQAWGATGIFATTADPRNFTASIPFNSASPVVPLTHKNGTTTHADIVPVANPKSNGGLALQLK